MGRFGGGGAHFLPAEGAYGDLWVRTKAGAAVALSVVVMALLAHVRVPLPFTPVPLTGQTFGVMLTGLLLGARRSGVALSVYGAVGLAGWPVFAGGGAGLAHLLGPTGGYLWGAAAGAHVTALVAGSRGGGRLTFLRAFVAATLGGIVAVYGIGVPHLALVTGLGWREAFVAGAWPFLAGDVLKAALAAGIAARFAPAVKRALS